MIRISNNYWDRDELLQAYLRDFFRNSLLHQKPVFQNMKAMTAFAAFVSDGVTSSGNMSRYYEALVQDKPSELRLPSYGLTAVDLDSQGSRYRFIPTAFGISSILASFAYYQYLTRRN